jgi:hypothetical protein
MQTAIPREEKYTTLCGEVRNCCEQRRLECTRSYPSIAVPYLTGYKTQTAKAETAMCTAENVVLVGTSQEVHTLVRRNRTECGVSGCDLQNVNNEEPLANVGSRAIKNFNISLYRTVISLIKRHILRGVL